MVEYGDSKEFIDWNLLRMDQPSKSKRTKQRGQEVSCESQCGPQRVDPYQKVEEISRGDLGKQDEKDYKSDEKRDEESFQ